VELALVELLAVLIVAVIVAEPVATAVTRPELETVAIEVELEFQATIEVMSLEVPPE
jgi:hypothetical protein